MEIMDICSQQSSQKPVKESPVLVEAIEDHLNNERYLYYHMTVKQARDSLLSEYNYQNRYMLKSCRTFGMTITPGDICYIDFGKAFVSEVGYQHFGLVLNIYNGKAFVVPMTSNYNAFRQAYDAQTNPEGMKHLMRLGKLDGLYKYSVLFLNDGKFINMARIIDIKAHLSTQSDLFLRIRKRAIDCITEMNE